MVLDGGTGGPRALQRREDGITIRHEEHLDTYLNDHWAAANAGIDVAERCLSNNPDGPLGAFLERFVERIREERALLEELLERRGSGTNALKAAAARFGARLGGLKPNDRLVAYSDLSRLEELETLVAGVRAKLGLWRSLEAAGVRPPRLDLPELVARAERQLEELERHRLDAARRAFTSGAPPDA